MILKQNKRIAIINLSKEILIRNRNKIIIETNKFIIKQKH